MMMEPDCFLVCSCFNELLIQTEHFLHVIDKSSIKFISTRLIHHVYERVESYSAV